MRRKHATDKGCPNCGMVEDSDHIFTRRSTVTEDILRSQEEKLRLYLKDMTSSQLQEAIKH